MCVHVPSGTTALAARASQSGKARAPPRLRTPTLPLLAPHHLCPLCSLLHKVSASRLRPGSLRGETADTLPQSQLPGPPAVHSSPGRTPFAFLTARLAGMGQQRAVGGLMPERDVGGTAPSTAAGAAPRPTPPLLFRSSTKVRAGAGPLPSRGERVTMPDRRAPGRLLACCVVHGSHLDPPSWQRGRRRAGPHWDRAGTFERPPCQLAILSPRLWLHWEGQHAQDPAGAHTTQQRARGASSLAPGLATRSLPSPPPAAAPAGTTTMAPKAEKAPGERSHLL